MISKQMVHVEWDRCGPQLVDALRRIVEDGLISGAGTRWAAAWAALERYERAANIGGAAEFMRKRYGKNWVLARRTQRIVAQYGHDVRCLTPREYAQCEADYYDGVAP